VINSVVQVVFIEVLY